MGDESKTIAVGFSPEARAELLAMYTGMAMQGLLMANVDQSDKHLANSAVAQANATIDALEAHHTYVAKQADIEASKANAGAPDVSSSQ